MVRDSAVWIQSHVPYVRRVSSQRTKLNPKIFNDSCKPHHNVHDHQSSKKKSSKLHSIWIIVPFFELEISHCFGQAPLQRCSTWPPVLRRWTSWSRRWRCSKQCSGRHGGRRCCWWRKGRSRWRCDLETGWPKGYPKISQVRFRYRFPWSKFI